VAHRVQLLVGRQAVLERYRAAVPWLGIYALTAGAALLVTPVTDEALDALHAVYGTGEWPERSWMRFASGDMAFAADASRVAPLAYVETNYADGTGRQGAMAWAAGKLAIAPVEIDAATQARRPAAVWPINMALTSLGMGAGPAGDPFERLGLTAWPSTEAILAGARRIA
jgi:hypothetical protein